MFPGIRQSELTRMNILREKPDTWTQDTSLLNYAHPKDNWQSRKT